MKILLTIPVDGTDCFAIISGKDDIELDDGIDSFLSYHKLDRGDIKLIEDFDAKHWRWRDYEFDITGKYYDWHSYNG